MADGPACNAPAKPDAPEQRAACKVAELAWLRSTEQDEDGAVPDAEILALAEYGLLHAPLPPALGGTSLGMSAGSAAAMRDVLRIIGGGSLSVGRLYEGHVNSVRLLTAYGTGAQLALLAREASSGRLSAVWNAQAGDGLRLEGSSLVGGKIYCSGIGLVHRPLLTAALPEGLLMLIPDVSGARPVLTAWKPLGMRASLSGSGDFTGIAVAAEERVGMTGDYYRAPLFAGGAWRVLAVQLGGLERLVDLYRMEMRIRGRSEDGVQRARFAGAVADLETARLWVTRAVEVAECPEDDSGESVALVNFARSVFERCALGIMERAQRGIGLSAMLRPNPVERIIRDLSTYLRQPFLDASLDAAAIWSLRDRPVHANMGST